MRTKIHFLQFWIFSDVLCSLISANLRGFNLFLKLLLNVFGVLIMAFVTMGE